MYCVKLGVHYIVSIAVQLPYYFLLSCANSQHQDRLFTLCTVFGTIKEILVCGVLDFLCCDGDSDSVTCMVCMQVRLVMIQ